MVRYMIAISRERTIVHWQLRPVIDRMEKGRPGWLTQRGLVNGVGGPVDEFGLSETILGSSSHERALQIQQGRHEADGRGTLASSDPLFPSSSFVLLPQAC